jgi:hypothetical protein
MRDAALDLDADTAAALRYAEEATATEGRPADGGPADLKGEARRIEAAIASLTGNPTQAFRAAMIAVAYWEAVQSVRAGRLDRDAAARECIHRFGRVKGGCAAALLHARLAREEERGSLDR